MTESLSTGSSWLEALEEVPHWSIPSDETHHAGLLLDDGRLELATSTGSASEGTEITSTSVTGAAVDGDAPGEWPVGNRNNARTGDAAWEEFITVPLETAWVGTTLDKVQTNPAIVDDVAYFGGAGSDRRVYAVDLRDGNLRWNVQIPGSVLSSPAVADDSVFFGGANGRLYRVSTHDGALQWQFPPALQAPVGAIVGASAVHDGIVYVASLDGNLYAVNADDGTLNWSASTPEAVTAGVTVANGRVIVTSGANEWVTAFDVSTHAQLWQRKLYDWADPNTLGTAASVAYGRAYVSGLDGRLYILDEATGNNAVTPFNIGVFAQSTPVLANNSVFLGTGDGRVLGLTPDGSLLWSEFLPFVAIVHSPIFASGLVFASSTDGTMYVIDAATGDPEWAYTTGGPLFAPPAVVSNHVVLGSDDKNVYGLSPGLPANETHPPQPIAHRYGFNRDELYAYDPVSTSTGNFVYSATDVTQPGRGVPTTFSRVYNALDAASDGPLGYGWTHSYNIALIAETNQVTVRWGDGHQDLHTSNADGSFTSPPDVRDVLRSTATGYELETRGHLVLRFDAAGKLIGIDDNSGNSTTLSYDTSSRLVAVTDAANRVVTLAYGPDGRVSAVTDALGRSWLYSYDLAGNLTGASDAAGNTWAYAYDSGHRMTEVRDPDGALVVRNDYDTSSRVILQTDSVGSTWGYVYEPGRTVVTDPLSRATVYEFDANFRTTKVTDPGGGTAQYIYDAQSNIIAAVDATGAASRFAYDERSNQIAALDPAGHKTAFNYNSEDQLTSIIDVKGNESFFEYDAGGRLLETRTPTGLATRIAYNADGTVASTTNGAGETTAFTYDARGFATTVTDPLGRATTLSYDDAGQLLNVADAAGGTTFEYDAAGRLIAVTDALNNRTRYNYDRTGRMVAVTDANSRTTSSRYDSRGRLVETEAPIGRRTTLAYDAAGQLVTKTDARGNVVTYGYDPAGRLARIGLPDQADITYAYDLAGRPTEMTDATGTNTYAYNTAGQLELESRTLLASYELGSLAQSEIAHTYDSLGRRKSLTLSRGGSVSGSNVYEYDGESRLAAIVDSVDGVTQFDYDPAGRLSAMELPDYTGITSSYEYDAAGQLTRLAHVNPAAANSLAEGGLSTWEYAYDPAGRRTQAVRRIVAAGTTLAAYTADYTYDSIGRLTSASNNDPAAPPTANATYTYDAVGNRTSQTVAGITTAYTYNAADELISDGLNTFEYDASGNMVERHITGNLAPELYTYDALGRTSAINVDGQSTSFSHDGMGRRAIRQDATGSTAFAFDGADVIEEVGPLFRAFTTTVDGLVLNRISAGQSFLLPDGNANVGELVSEAGGVLLNRYHYDAYGSHTTTPSANATDTTQNRHTFSGTFGVHDQVGGLLDMRARLYDPALGRFLSPDPWPSDSADPQTINRYAYAHNNPISQLDPYGLYCVLGKNPNGSCRGSGAAATVGNFLEDNRHAIVDVGIGVGTVVGFTACGITVICGVGIGAAAVVGGTGVHVVADAWTGNPTGSAGDYAIRSAIAAGGGILCGYMLGTGCAGATAGLPKAVARSQEYLRGVGLTYSRPLAAKAWGIVTAGKSAARNLFGLSGFSLASTGSTR